MDDPLDIHRRISARAVLAGILVGLALAAMFMALGAAIGASTLPRTGNDPRSIGLGFAAWFIVALTVSAFGGGWVAAGAARALRRRDGVLHAIVTWAAMALASSSLVGGVMHRVAVGMLGDRTLASPQLGAWGAFAALCIPLLAAIAGGLIAASRERHVLGVSRRVPPVQVTLPTGRPIAP